MGQSLFLWSLAFVVCQSPVDDPCNCQARPCCGFEVRDSGSEQVEYILPRIVDGTQKCSCEAQSPFGFEVRTTGLSEGGYFVPRYVGDMLRTQPSSNPPSGNPPSGDEEGGGLGTLGNERNSNFGAGGAAAASAGAGTATAKTGAGTPVSSPLILPGMFTAFTAQSAAPIDRIWFNYGYFDSFRVSSAPVIAPNGVLVSQGGNRPGFDLNVFDLGVEKTLLGGRVSVYLDVPLLLAYENNSGQNISGIGDINVGFKSILLQDEASGSVLSGGLTVTVPTGHDSQASSLVCTNTNSGGFALQPSSTATLNPTYIQPWIAGLWALDHRFYVSDYFGVLVPSDDRVATVLNNDFTLAWNVYQSRSGLISSVTPMVGAQALIPVSHIGAQNGSSAPAGTYFSGDTTNLPPPPAPNNFGFPDQLFINAGVTLGVGERALWSTSVVVPVVGPVGYSYGVTMGLSFLF